MDIPKNTTQIGEVYGNYRIYIEDYVISYIKQLCRQEPYCNKRIAFYGVTHTEQDLQYFFIYGGCRVEMQDKKDCHLTSEDYKEITRAGEKYFENYVSVGYAAIEDELPDGIFILSGGKEKYVKGYHIFYEKNDSMLTFLLDRQTDQPMIRPTNQPTNQPKNQPTNQPKIQPATRTHAQFANETKDSIPGEIKLFGIVKSVAAALFIVICVTAISTMNGLDKIDNLQHYFQKAFGEMAEKKIPDREDMTPVIEDIAPAIKDIAPVIEDIAPATENIIPAVTETETVSDNEAEETDTLPDNVAQTADIVIENKETVKQPASYTVKEGETLISISKMFYGDESMVRSICELNGITNSDNIQVGQKIILP